MSRLYKRRDSQYYWYTNYHKGIRIRQSTKLTKRRLAERVKDDWDMRLQMGDTSFIKDDTQVGNRISDYCQQHISFIQSRKSRNTYQVARSVLNRFMEYAEGCNLAFMDEIRVTHIDGYIEWLDKAPKTKKNHLGVLSRMFNQAIKEELISTNPCDSATLPKMKKSGTHNHRPLNREDLKAIFTSPGPYKLYYSFLFYTGLRAGDVSLLRYENIDLKRQCITQLVRKSRRVHELPVNAELFKQLKQIKWGSGPIFPDLYSENEQRLNDNLYRPRKHLQDVLENAGRPQADLHSFRVTYNNHLRDLGLSIQDRQVLLAHTSSETTKIYTHPNADLARKYLDRLPNIDSIKGSNT